MGGGVIAHPKFLAVQNFLVRKFVSKNVKFCGWKPPVLGKFQVLITRNLFSEIWNCLSEFWKLQLHAPPTSFLTHYAAGIGNLTAASPECQLDDKVWLLFSILLVIVVGLNLVL